MRLTAVPVTLALALACPAGALAQSWDDAYRRGDYATAAAALHPLVFQPAESDRERSYPDARATQTLGQMYAAGLGVARDSVVACALFGLATGSAVYQHGDGHALTDAARRLLDGECVKLTAEERTEAAKLAECPSMRLGTQAFTLGAAHRVELQRGVVRVHLKNDRRDHWLGDLVDCAPVVPAVRHTAVRPRRGSKLPVRHFLEVLAWRARPDRDGQAVHVLEWRAVEIRGTDLAIVARTTLDTADSVSAAGTAPADARLVSMRMLGNGQVRWQTAQDPRASGIITRPTGSARAARRPKQE
jgi:hypothetical protein